MGGAFAYLIVCSTRNLVRTRIKRLRQPRYALGTIFGLLYFYWVFGRSAGRTLAMVGVSREAVESGGALVVFLFVALMWLWPGKKAPALGFTAAEVQHLFPAPITRRQLIWYRIARAQMGVLVSAMLFTLLARPPDAAGVVARFAGLCLLLGALGFHGMGMSLSRESLGKRGWAGVIRKWLPLALIAAIVTVLTATLVSHWPRLLELQGWRVRLEAAAQILSTGAASIALWPIRALMRVPTAVGWTGFLSALPPALLIWALNALWVVRSDAAFEEASAEHAEKVAQILRGKSPLMPRMKVRRPPFVLAPTGQPEIALLWKNLILVGRQSRAALIGGMIGVFIVVVVIIVLEPPASVSDLAVMMCLAFAFMTILTGPLQARYDLRQDLAHLATLKTWPLRGAVVVRGEVLAPAIVLSGLTSLLIVTAAAFGREWFAASQQSWMTRASLTAAAVFVSSGVIAVQVVAQNGIAVLFPAWIRIGPKAAGSVEGMGQQMLMMVASLVMVPLVALPAALAGAIVWIALQWMLGFVPVLVPATIATVVLLVECWVAIEAIGGVLDRTDVSAIDPA